MAASLVPWLRIVHVTGLVLWMGGLLVISRIMAYHINEMGMVRQRLAFVERKLLFGVALPGLVLSLATGIWMLIDAPGLLRNPGFHLKLTLVLVLVAGTVWTAVEWRRLARGVIVHSGLRFKLLHSLLAASLIAVLIALKIVVPAQAAAAAQRAADAASARP
jgi:putative membrane protein